MATMNESGVFVVGSTNVDMTNYVDRMPKVGETLCSRGFEQTFGGKGANQAIAAARLGCPVHMLTKVGTDHFGTAALQNFRENGIKEDYIYLDGSSHTGLASITVDAHGDNFIISSSGVNQYLEERDINEQCHATICNSSVVIAQLEIPYAVIGAALQLAQGSQLATDARRPVTILNPAPAATDIPVSLLANTDVIVPNESETETLTGISVDTSTDTLKAAARNLCSHGPRVAIITLGSKGAFLMAYLDETNDTNEPFYWSTIYPPFEVPKVEDTVGAGDAFIGGLAFALWHSRCVQTPSEGQRLAKLGISYPQLEKCVKFACACGSYSVQTRGAQTSLPLADESLTNLLV